MNIAQKNILYGLIIGFFSFILGYFLSGTEGGYTLKHTIPSQEGEMIYNSPKIREVYSFVEKYYYGFHAKDKKKLEDDYISAMTIALGDKHTNYFNTLDSERFIDSLAGDFQGIGAVIQDHKKGILVVKVLNNSPAEKNKIEAGDIITHVNGETMVNVPSSEAVNKIRGPKGTKVKLTIISVKNEQKKNVEIQRDIVVVPSVEHKMLTGSIGYIEVSMFGETTASDVKKALKSLSSSGAKVFILDARNNGGGYLDSAVDILSFFLGDNVVGVLTRGNNPKDNQTFYTKKGEFSLEKSPIVMLINSMSASATEILAGALQDYNRALIVGETSYGKGSVQTPFSLSDGSLVKITTAKWYTPKERGIDEKGIDPDVVIHFREEDFKTLHDRQLEGAIEIAKMNIDNKKSIEEWKETAKKNIY